ncbi:MAG: T9SS type A sorting domain-containing protein [Bacteroidales bacterium]|nr:T9SS type A sorting domain-containing protein [Bacteroidales bacterium]
MKKLFSILALLLMVSFSTKAQTKENVARECVLFEVFTGVRCPYCPAAANGIAQMMDEGLAIAPVAYHTTAFSTDAYYTNETNARASYYAISSYPTVKPDGMTGVSGGGSASDNMYSYYIGYYNQRINKTSPFTIDLGFEPNDDGTCQVNCTVNQVAECDGTNIRVFIALTQSNINVGWQGMQGLHHVCRDMIPTQTGTPFTGPSMTISETFELPYPKEDCYLTAWVQNYTGTKEVYQAVRMSTLLDLDYDLVLKNAKNVITSSCSGYQKPVLTVKNLGNQTVTLFDIHAVSDDQDYVQTWHGVLEAGQTTTVQMDEFVAAPGEAIQFIVSMPNGENDGFMADNALTVNMEETFNIDGYLKLQLRTGNHPESLSVEILETGSGQTVESFTFEQSSHVYTEEIVLLNAGCYRIIVRDELGESMGTGYFQIKDANNRLIMKGGGASGAFGYEMSTELTCDGTLGHSETVSTPVKLYPNPSDGLFYVDLGSSEWQVTIFDAMGRKVFENPMKGNSSLDLRHLNKGVYFMKANSGTQEYKTKLILH